MSIPAIATEPKGRLGQLLAEVTPGDLHKTFFTLGGAEANKNAVKFARLYQVELDLCGAPLEYQ